MIVVRGVRVVSIVFRGVRPETLSASGPLVDLFPVSRSHPNALRGGTGEREGRRVSGLVRTCGTYGGTSLRPVSRTGRPGARRSRTGPLDRGEWKDWGRGLW